MIKRICLILPVVIAAGLLFAGCAEEAGQEIEFETLSMGYYSQVSQESSYVIKEEHELQQIWDSIEENSPPVIDFESNMVLAVFQGEQPTGGYEIEIERIVETADKLQVYIKEISPDPDDMVIQALTYPYHIVKMPLVDKNVEFIK